MKKLTENLCYIFIAVLSWHVFAVEVYGDKFFIPTLISVLITCGAFILSALYDSFRRKK